MTDEPRSRTISIFGVETDLNLNAGKLRYAQLKGEELSPQELEEFTDFGLGCRLAYIAMLPELPEGKTEEDVMLELTKRNECDEIASHCLRQYLEMQNELGKYLQETVEGIMDTNESLTSERLTE